MGTRVRPLIVALAGMLIPLVAAELAFRSSDLHERLRAQDRYTALSHHLAHEVTEDPDVVFLGDSRTINGVRPDVVERAVADLTGQEITAYNLGLQGSVPMVHLAWVDHLIHRASPPRLVVIHTAPYQYSTIMDPAQARKAIPSLFTARGAWHALSAGMLVEQALQILGCNALSSLRYRQALLAMVFEGQQPGEPVWHGEQGYIGCDSVELTTQRHRAVRRAAEYARRAAVYARETRRPQAELDVQQRRYLETTIERLHEHGVQVALVTSPVAVATRFNDGRRAIYGEYREMLDEIAAEHGVPLADHREQGVLPDYYFVDGDHATEAGALRYSTYLAQTVVAPVLDSAAPPPAAGRWGPRVAAPSCDALFDFEAYGNEGWRVTGNAFVPGLVSGAVGGQETIDGFAGVQLVNSHPPLGGDRAVGEALSPPFVLQWPALTVRVGGCAGDGLRVELVVDGAAVRTARGDGTPTLKTETWDVSPWVGATVRVRIVDDDPSGYVLVDQIEGCQ